VLKINVFITLSASVLLFLFSEFIIIRTFGNEYSEAIFIFRLLLVYFAFTIIDSVFANTLIGLMKEKVYTLSLLFALIIFLIMTFILTPYIGEYSVIYSFMVINIISLSYMIFFIKRDIKIKVTRLIIVPILFAGVVFLFLALFKASFYIEILFAAFIFIPLLSIILGMGKEEINFIKRIFI
jgi:O-antigen/teichoic acid export membrane protein